MDDPNDNFEAFLKRNSLAAPSRPANEWARLSAQIEESRSWFQVFQDALTSKDFWVPVISLAAAASLVLVFYTQSGTSLNSDESINNTLDQISELYSTDLDPSTSIADYSL